VITCGDVAIIVKAQGDFARSQCMFGPSCQRCRPFRVSLYSTFGQEELMSGDNLDVSLCSCH
jgi:hypothetical protein